MSKHILVALLLLLSLHARGQGVVYLCPNEDGVPEYRNTADGTACRKVDLPDLVIVKPDAAAEAVGTTAMPPPQVAEPGHRRALEIRLRTAEARLSTLKKEFNGGEPERRGDERNYAKYMQRVATMQEEVRRAEQYVNTLKQELSR